MRTLVYVSLSFVIAPLFGQQDDPQILPPSVQIKTATLPLPEMEKEGAMVYGYDDSGALVVLREGKNRMVCLSDNPGKEGISVSCYSIDLEPFMKRGRELDAQGKDVEEKRSIRGSEIEAGTLYMPKAPSMMYVYYGSEEAYDQVTGELGDGQFRYVIYTPFATTESTGLPDKPHAKGMPWLMDPGTHRAHIMVGPLTDRPTQFLKSSNNSGARDTLLERKR